MMKTRSKTTTKDGQVVARPTRAELLEAIRGIIVEQCGHELERVRPDSSLVMDLGIDSLDLVELVMAVEEEFDIEIPETRREEDPIFQQVFTRPNFTVSDFAELVYLQWGTSSRAESERPWPLLKGEVGLPVVAFTQLDGVYDGTAAQEDLFEAVEISNVEGYAIHRRRSDGMACVEIPSTDEVKMNGGLVSIDRFLIDVEPVSTTAYARFLNSIGPVDAAMTELWFDLPKWDKRRVHLPLERLAESPAPIAWAPRPGGETWPMMLVSWFGANAYALWANGADWREFRDQSPYLPSLVQFEFAARGTEPQLYPWGDEEPDESLANLARLEFRKNYSFGELPLSPVNENLGVSPFGLRHMAGNVWHWCRDWRDPQEKKVRCEKGGSWVGPADLARCSHHRGRPPEAKGRCLGFRCVRPMT